MKDDPYNSLVVKNKLSNMQHSFFTSSGTHNKLRVLSVGVFPIVKVQRGFSYYILSYGDSE
jgi:hypothetical protein